ncbi:arylesterase [Saccharophagus sp. K07]|uniref:arylesterase n=1 Tax=Saccharophagus sp. K07 TaxID=2283636 RepID=UPI00165295A7|nr:arylesterase [Saccharophagus sp. K07]MBC6905922.1 arylesterase [Saccharophagus sp. K07]
MSHLLSARVLVFWFLLLSIPLQVVAEAPRILVLGDSLSAAYGIEVRQGWVSLLEQRLAGKYPHVVINASVSGETTGGGLARLPALLQQHQPSVVIVELGGNDGLRGYPLNVMQQQMTEIIEKSRAAGATVVLVGMQIPPNYGPRYTNRFRDIYKELAEKFGLPLVQFLLEGVATEAALMQRDGIHPTAEAQEKILDNVWSVLQPLLVKE